MLQDYFMVMLIANQKSTGGVDILEGFAGYFPITR
jgi:hypothetical protein